MKQIILIALTLLLSDTVSGQTFTAITSGEIVTTNSASRSANFIDINGDGWDDIFISNGPSTGQNNMLYINNQDGTFTNVTNNPITSDGAKSDGATFGDADNDGDLDACVVTWYGQINNYYEGQGKYSFSHLENVITQAGTYSETASWGDMDNDGWLDLYVTNSEGNKRNKLFRNTGEGSFEEVTAGPAVSSLTSSRSVDWIDYDVDGDLDIFVTNENSQQNELFQNDGSGTFTKVTGLSFLEPNKKSAGSSWADIDNDGDFDLFVANYQAQANELYINNGDGTFSAITAGSIVQDFGWSFGSSFADMDNDGDLDLYVCNAFGGIEKNHFYINNGDGTFERDNESAPAVQSGWTFGCAWGDYNNDGFMDLVLANCKDDNQKNSLFRNDGNDNHWFKLSCEGVQTNRSAIGTVVRAKSTINGQSFWQTRRIEGQSGYNCQNSLTAHFGLGDASTIDSLVIEWGVGNTQIFENVNVNSFCTLKEGESLECQSTSTQEIATNSLDFKIYPNPSNGKYLEIENPFESGEKDIAINIIDFTGKSVFQQNLTQSGNTIVLDSLQIASGSYKVMLRQDKLIKNSTLVVY